MKVGVLKNRNIGHVRMPGKGVDMEEKNELQNALEAKRTFEQNMMGRIREDIGKLLPDDALKALITEGMRKAFFENRVEPSGSYSTKELPPLFVEVLTELTDKRVRAAVDAYLTEHVDEVSAMIENIFIDGFVARVARRIDERFSDIHLSMADKIQVALRNGQFPYSD